MDLRLASRKFMGFAFLLVCGAFALGFKLATFAEWAAAMQLFCALYFSANVVQKIAAPYIAAAASPQRAVTPGDKL